jgi:hypothetical protein
MPHPQSVSLISLACRFVLAGLVFGATALLTPACQQSSSRSGGSSRQGTGNKAAGTHLGKAFTRQARVDLDQLVDGPKKFEGQRVRVQGVITAHCHHRRAWFALRSKSDSPKVLRVQTRPAFLVPKEIEHGKSRAEAEGTVEVRTIGERHAKHMAREHGLFGGEPAKIRGPQHIVTLRARGARIYQN